LDLPVPVSDEGPDNKQQKVKKYQRFNKWNCQKWGTFLRSFSCLLPVDLPYHLTKRES